MKRADLGQIIRFDGRLYEVISSNEGKRSLGLRSLDPNHCPHCGGVLEHDFIDIIEASPLFQESAQAVKTLTNDDVS